MLTLKIMRGMSAVVSNQAGSISSSVQVSHKQSNRNISLSSLDSTLTQSQRNLSSDVIYHQASTTRTSKQQKIPPALADVDLPDKPKKPETPWISFVRERKDEVFRLKGKMTAAELAVILAPEWKQTDKTRFEEEYKQKHNKYMELVENYQRSLTPEQLDLLNFKKSTERQTKASKLLRKTGPPVLPRNPANIYCHERSKHDDFKEMLKYKKAAQVFSDIFKEYRSLSDEQKRKYLEMQDEDKVRFQQEFLDWYEGVQNNENLTKAAREQADKMRDRFRALKYI